MNTEKSLLCGLVSANEAVYQRFTDLPSSLKSDLKKQLVSKGYWLHFRRLVCKPGWDLSDTSLGCALIVCSTLNINIEAYNSNCVKPATFAEYSSAIQG